MGRRRKRGRQTDHATSSSRREHGADATDRQAGHPKPDPPRRHKRLLIASVVLFLVWFVFLAYVAAIS